MGCWHQAATGQAQRRQAGLADACGQSPGHGVSTRVHGAGGQNRRELVSVLQGGAPASHCVAAVASLFTGANLRYGTTQPGATVRGGHVHGLASQRKRLRVALRAALDRPNWRNVARIRSAVLHGYRTKVNSANS